MMDEPPASDSSKLLDFRDLLPKGLLRQFTTPLNPFLEKRLGILHLNTSYRRVQADCTQADFYTKAQRALELSYAVSDEDLARIPKKGPVIVVTNHPFGGVDGVILGAMLGAVRDDFKIMANYLLAHMREIEPWFIGVDPFERKSSTQFNFSAIKDTLRFLQGGGCLGIFPSGTVSHWQWQQRQITDPPWSPNLARFVHKSQATVVPVFFEGCNCWSFQLLGLLHPLVRTLLLPRAMMKAQGSTLRIRIGTAIPYRKLAHYDDPAKLTDFLRLNTYLLKQREETTSKKRLHLPSLPWRVSHEQPIGDAIEPTILEQEVTALPREQQLVEHSHFVVYYAFAEQIPALLDEIGRLREKTFREVGEGTGEPLDLDRFDLYYRHLFMWDRSARKVVGSYRIGATDEILRTQGKGGLYTSTLFKFKPSFLQTMGPALEMGRSFIVSEYQKKHASLLLIWRAIGQYVVRNPRYKILFGPVSISKEYNAISKDLMVKFLRKERFDPTLSSLVKAKNPPRGGPCLRGTEKQALLKAVHNIEDVSALISEIETDKKGIPTLLRHYLKMNGQLLSFNVDHEFGHCIDGLVVVDLTKSHPRLLRSYLGLEGHRSFLQHHNITVECGNV